MQIRQLGSCRYQPVYEQMLDFNQQRQTNTEDEIWVLEHLPVFTQGQAGKAEHILNAGDIPIVQTDRGGQVTYHGPGQLVVYPLLDIRRLKLGPRQLVSLIEDAIIHTLQQWDIVAMARRDAPGVYVEDRKIASLGLRISRGCSMHGLALNVAMDLEPFQRINPCGYAGMVMTDMQREAGQVIEISDVAAVLETVLVDKLVTATEAVSASN